MRDGLEVYVIESDPEIQPPLIWHSWTYVKVHVSEDAEDYWYRRYSEQKSFGDQSCRSYRRTEC